MTDLDLCSCGHQRPFADCCERFITGLLSPETAEELMRSRYTAYARGFVDYLVETHDPDKRAPALRESVSRWAARARFQELRIIDTVDGGAEDDTGVVAFEARYREDGNERTLQERSRFRRHEGRWVYVAGTTKPPAPITRSEPKVGRNAPCPCGSGKKYKRCCA